MLHSASVSKASENILLSSEQGSEVSVAQSCWHFETPWTTVLCRGARPLFTWYAEDSSFQFPSVFTDSLLSLLEPWFLPGFLLPTPLPAEGHVWGRVFSEGSAERTEKGRIPSGNQAGRRRMVWTWDTRLKRFLVSQVSKAVHSVYILSMSSWIHCIGCIWRSLHLKPSPIQGIIITHSDVCCSG